ncbi:ATP-binding cassette domain-containing protein [Gordonia sp. NPDC003585]|uniref:ABC transporter ATP-binding protein n=1 Tax=unclassified Gordonia (in: high G+C Gram-positive bacteria) TaxID=2657482 RepID=UPI0033AF0CC1
MEIASIAIFGGLTVAAVVVAAVIPLAQAAGLLAPVPLALVAARTRPRALIAATVATTLVAFAMAGTGAMATVVGSALVGGIVGDLKRRGRGLGSILLATLIASPLIGGLSVIALLILVPLRNLAIEAMTNSINGVAKWLHRWDPLSWLGDWLETVSQSLASHWWVWIWVSGTVGTAVSLLVAWWILGAVIRRLADVPSEDTLASDLTSDDEHDIAPLPLRATDVGFAYRAGARQVLHDVDLTIEKGEFVAIVGANGSGKSTLAKVLAGRAPTTGSITRPGLAGLGQRGGTAMVLQRPETQMLGSRVADDLVWGLPADADVDVEALLAEVGLAGLGQRETSDLSGGQQQRLAIAAALARDPALLIADEVTSMVDPLGREQLLELLAGLPARRGITVVLITHRGTEAARADRVIHLVDGRVVPHAPDWVPTGVTEDEPVAASTLHVRPHHAPPEPLLVLDHVGHAHLAGSPWEVVALQDVSLTVHRSDGVLIVGGNGSGKTTLAWIMAGLIAPGSGTATLDGAPVTGQVGKVGLGFQHARLQLQKATVGDEIMAAGGDKVGTAEVARVLELVGLPREMATTGVDALSGGQMRRVVLAGLIARTPQVLVLDEPLAGLDPYARQEIVDLLARLRRDGQTIVIISHDFEALDSVCDRRVELVDGRLDAGAALAGGAR